jgi:hypothetical protein
MQDDLMCPAVAGARSMLKQLVITPKVKNERGAPTWTFPRVTGFWQVPPRGLVLKTCHGTLFWRHNT